MVCEPSVLPLAIALTLIIAGVIGLGLWSFYIMIDGLVGLLRAARNYIKYGRIGERIYPDRIPRNETDQ